MSHTDRAFIKAFHKEGPPFSANPAPPAAKIEETVQAIESEQYEAAEQEANSLAKSAPVTITPENNTLAEREASSPAKRRALSDVMGLHEGHEPDASQQESTAPSLLSPLSKKGSAGAKKGFLRVDGPHQAAPHFPHLFTRSTPVAGVNLPPTIDISEKRDGETENEEAPLQATEHATPSAPSLPQPQWKPQWEVDAFQWPSICDDLLEATDEDLDRIIERTHAAIRLGRRFLHVTSRSRGAGRTSMALFLARVLAGTGLRIALVDADLQNPQLAENLGVATEINWATSEDKTAEALEEAAIYSIEDAMTLFPLHPMDPPKGTPKDLENLDSIIEIWNRFDLAIFDSPPDDEASSTPQGMKELQTHASAVVVRDIREDSIEKTSALIDQIDASGIGLIGVVENYVGGQSTRRAA